MDGGIVHLNWAIDMHFTIGWVCGILALVGQLSLVSLEVPCPCRVPAADRRLRIPNFIVMSCFALSTRARSSHSSGGCATRRCMSTGLYAI